MNKCINKKKKKNNGSKVSVVNFCYIYIYIYFYRITEYCDDLNSTLRRNVLMKREHIIFLYYYII